MTSSDRALARRYTKALFQLAAQDRHEEKIAKELSDAQRALLDHMDVLKHPMVAAVRKKALLKKTLGNASPLTMRFLELLVDKKRLQLLSVAVVEFGQILNEKKGRIRAQVKSAAELSSAEEEKLRKKLEKFSGKEVVLDVKVDEGLLGGVIVRMNDWVIDGSLKGKLKRLGAELAENAYAGTAH